MFKHLHLHRLLIILDCETTGLDPAHDRIIELGLVRLVPGHEPRSRCFRFHPQVPIPPAASVIHGIRDEHVADCPPFAAMAAKIARWIGDGDLGGFNIARFDLPFLVAEFDRAGWEFPLRGRKIVDALTIFHAREPRDLSAAVRYYCHREHEHAHRADADALAAAAVLDAMLGKYKDLPRSVADLHKQFIDVDVGGWFRRDETGAVIFARGKYRDQALTEVARCDPGYLAWLGGKVVLPDTRRLVDHALCQAAK
jgi:DNA polymerase-3 subunit epsilon